MVSYDQYLSCFGLRPKRSVQGIPGNNRHSWCWVAEKTECLQQYCWKVWLSGKARRFFQLKKCKKSATARRIPQYDLKASLADELVLCSSFLNAEFSRRHWNPMLRMPLSSSTPAISFNLNCACTGFLFPITVIVFRIYVGMMVLNCSSERSFSELKLLKNNFSGRRRDEIALLCSTLKTVFCVIAISEHIMSNFQL